MRLFFPTRARTPLVAAAATLVALAGCGGGGSSRGGAASTIAPVQSSGPAYVFQNVGPLAQARVHHTATLLADGRILVAGGLVSSTQATAQVEILDPQTGRTTAAAPMLNPRMQHAAVLLPTRRVLVIGGQSDRFGAALRSTEVYDPLTDRWSAGPDLSVGRSGPAVALYESGRKALIAGGATIQNNQPVVHDTADIYSADSNTIAPSTARMRGPRCYADAHAQANGQILLVSGFRTVGTAQPAASEVYDTLNDIFIPVTMRGPRAEAASAVLSDGIHSIGGVTSAAAMTSSELFDGQAWASAPGCKLARSSHTATVVGTDAFLIGGRDGQAVFTGVEMYPTQVAAVGSGAVLVEGRYDHTATLVGDQIVVIGGFAQNDDILASIEVYAPAAATVPGSGAPRGQRVSGRAPPAPPPPAQGAVTIASLSPTSGNVGSQVEITGTGFAPAPVNNVVRFNGVQAVVTSVDLAIPSAQKLRCVVPNGATTGAVSVQVGQAVAMGPVFTVGSGTSQPPSGPPPRILFVLPNSGRSFFPVSITGTDFGSQPIVTFNGVPTINIVNLSTRQLPIIGSVSELVVIIPPGASSGQLVITSGTQQSNPFYFTVR